MGRLQSCLQLGARGLRTLISLRRWNRASKTQKSCTEAMTPPRWSPGPGNLSGLSDLMAVPVVLQPATRGRKEPSIESAPKCGRSPRWLGPWRVGGFCADSTWAEVQMLGSNSWGSGVGDWQMVRHTHRGLGVQRNLADSGNQREDKQWWWGGAQPARMREGNWDSGPSDQINRQVQESGLVRSRVTLRRKWKTVLSYPPPYRGLSPLGTD